LKHVKKDKLCPYYLAGFCPEGKSCKNGAHPRFPTDLKKPEVRVQKSKEELEKEKEQREQELEKEEERDRDDRNPVAGGGHKRGGWQGDRRKRRGGGRHRRGGF
jgi:cleavage and polyadenylation specificity factor subunit 4